MLGGTAQAGTTRIGLEGSAQEPTCCGFLGRKRPHPAHTKAVRKVGGLPLVWEDTLGWSESCGSGAHSAVTFLSVLAILHAPHGVTVRLVRVAYASDHGRKVAEILIMDQTTAPRLAHAAFYSGPVYCRTSRMAEGSAV